MSLKPMHDTIFGELIQHQMNDHLLSEFQALTSQAALEAAGRGRFQAESYLHTRQVEATITAKKNAHYQALVTAVGPECVELECGDIAVLPPFGGTMLTVVDEETGGYQRVFAIRERDVLARFRGDE